MFKACMHAFAEVELELITDPDMLLMIEKGIRGGTCNAILRYAEANNKYMKDDNKDASNLYGSAMSEPLPVGGFEWMKYLSKTDEYFIKKL